MTGRLERRVGYECEMEVMRWGKWKGYEMGEGKLGDSHGK